MWFVSVCVVCVCVCMSQNPTYWKEFIEFYVELIERLDLVLELISQVKLHPQQQHNDAREGRAGARAADA